jgi:hypothetical protein
MANPIDYFLPLSLYQLSTREIFGFAERTAVNNALTEALAGKLLEDIQQLVLAHLIQPLDSNRFYTICASAGPEVAKRELQRELPYTTACTSDLLECHRFINPETSIAMTAAVAQNVQRLCIRTLHIANLAEYLEHFPRVRTLALEGEFPEGAAIASSHLETLNLFGISNPETAVAHVQPSCTNLRRCERLSTTKKVHAVLPEPLRPIVDLIAQNALRCLPTPLREQAKSAIARSSEYWDWDMFDEEVRVGRIYILRFRAVLDGAELSSIPDSLFPPLSTIRTLILDHCLPTFDNANYNSTFRMIVSDYLIDCDKKSIAMEFRQPNRYQLPLADVETAAAQYVRVKSSEPGLLNAQLANIQENAALFIKQAKEDAEARATAAAQIVVLNDDN